MFSRFMPKEAKFFDHFNAHADQVSLAGKELGRLIAVRDQSEAEAEKIGEAIYEMEKRGDEIARETMRQLHKSFITPLEREEIHQLITGLDETLDLIQDAAQTVNLYNVQKVTPEALRMTDLVQKCCEKLCSAVHLLHSMDNSTKILEVCNEIDQLESEADREMRGAMSKLFRDEPDVRELIKLKAVYEILECITDRCEAVADIIEGIVLENS